MRYLETVENKEVAGGIFTTKDAHFLVVVPRGELSEDTYNYIDTFFEKAFNNEITWKLFESKSVWGTSRESYDTYILNFCTNGVVINLY